MGTHTALLDLQRMGRSLLHYITLELFRVAESTNTAKPPLYTVCRTRKRKQLERK